MVNITLLKATAGENVKWLKKKKIYITICEKEALLLLRASRPDPEDGKDFADFNSWPMLGLTVI